MLVGSTSTAYLAIMAMETSRRSEDDELKIEGLASADAAAAGAGDGLDGLLEKIEAAHAGDGLETVEPAGDSQAPAGDGATADENGGSSKTGDGSKTAATVEEILDKVGVDAAGRLEDTIKADEERLKTSSHRIVANKVRKNSKKYQGYAAFCLGAIVLGAVWLIVGLLTKSVWPIPFFGVWNEVCGAFLVVWGGLMLLNAR